jgi:hypothetical protein
MRENAARGNAAASVGGGQGRGQVRDDLRDYVPEHFADPGAVLVADETGDLKHGTATVGPRGSTPAPPGGLRTPRHRRGRNRARTRADGQNGLAGNGLVVMERSHFP